MQMRMAFSEAGNEYLNAIQDAFGFETLSHRQYSPPIFHASAGAYLHVHYTSTQPNLRSCN
jgi:hypothetical protein